MTAEAQALPETGEDFAYLADRVSRNVCSTQEAERFVSIAFKMRNALVVARQSVASELSSYPDCQVAKDDLATLDTALAVKPEEAGDV